MVKLLFFGRFSDIAEAREIDLPPNITDSAGLIAWLCDDNPALKGQFDRAGNHIAINQTMIDDVTPIKAGDEIAFMSALSGG